MSFSLLNLFLKMSETFGSWKEETSFTETFPFNQY